MRLLPALSSIALTGALILGLTPDMAEAGPLPTLAAPNVTASAVEKTGYTRRYYRQLRRYGYVPGAVPVVPPAAVVVEPGAVLVPLRPTSCGQYHYWNGVACVDARYNNPDLGPQP